MNIWNFTECQWDIFLTIFGPNEMRYFGEETLAMALAEGLSKESEGHKILREAGLVKDNYGK